MWPLLHLLVEEGRHTSPNPTSEVWLVKHPAIYRYPLCRVVSYWTASDGTLVEHLECGHDYVHARVLSGRGEHQRRRCKRCGPAPPRTCAQCDKPLTPDQGRLCSTRCRRRWAERAVASNLGVLGRQRPEKKT